MPFNHPAQNVAYKKRRVSRERRFCFISALVHGRHLDLKKMLQSRVHGLQIHPHHFFAFFTVGFLNGFFDFRDGPVFGQHAGNGEKANLHHGVDPSAHARIFGHLEGVDHVKLQLFLNDLTPYRARQMPPHFAGAEMRIQKKGAAPAEILEHVVAFEKYELVAAHEIRLVHEIGRADRLGAKTQMRNRDRTRFFGIVNKIALGEIVRVFSDDFDGIFIGAHSTVRTQAVKDAAKNIVGFYGKGGVRFQAGLRHIVNNTHGEMILERSLSKVVEHGFHHGGRELFGRKPVAAS